MFITMSSQVKHAAVTLITKDRMQQFIILLDIKLK